MKIGRLEIFVYTNCPSIKPSKTDLYLCTDIDWLYWTFRLFKKVHIRKAKLGNRR